MSIVRCVVRRREWKEKRKADPSLLRKVVPRVKGRKRAKREERRKLGSVGRHSTTLETKPSIRLLVKRK